MLDIKTATFGQIYSKYYPLVKKTVSGYLEPNEEIEDFITDVFVKTWNSLDKYDSEKAVFTTWISAIARNHCIDHIRDKRKKYAIECPDTCSYEIEEFIPSDVFFEEREVNGHLLAKAVYAVMYDNFDVGQQMLADRYFNQLTYEEISEKYETKVNNVKITIRRSKDKLKSYIERKYGKSHILESTI
jgi:RNA polymerase sigma-70 factor (ECF subfamily)